MIRLHRIFLRTYSLPANPQFTTTLEEVRLLASRGHLDEAFVIISTMETSSPSQAYAGMLHACAGYNRLDLGRAIHHKLLAGKTTASIDLYTTNHLINMYAKCGDLNAAHQVFDEMPHKNIFSWTCLITGYSQRGISDKCFDVFSKMLVHFKPNDFSYTSVLSVCDRFCGMQVHAHVLKTGFDTCVYVGNALIAMYSKKTDTGPSRFGDAIENQEESWRVFSGMEFRNMITWNSIIAGFQMLGQYGNALNHFSLMRGDVVGFDRATLVSIVSSLCAADETDYLSVLKCCFQLHCLLMKSGFHGDVAVITALLKAYSTLGGEVADCHKLFSERNGCGDVVLWTEIIAVFADRDPVEAFILFIQLQKEFIRPDCHTYSIALKACGRFMTDRQTLAVYSQVTRSGFAKATVIRNALIHSLGRCGSIISALQVFNEMGTKDVVSWNSILKAFSLQGQAKEALNFFKQMDVEPNASTFVALLSACSHSGLVNEGNEIFSAMFEKYGIIPQLDHYACMVDILGRSGNLLEAMKIIREMPMEPDYVVWSALLGGCRKHGENQLARLCVSKLRELDPGNSLGYVLISNIYCSAGSFDDAGLIRKDMKGLGIKKEPGLSWTEIRNQVHEFASGGKGHPQGEAIRSNLRKFICQLREEEGYVPESSLALHDLEEEQKEEQLYFHSEKLAFAYALMMNHSNSLGGYNKAIRIMKNIRICPDCHNFMKLASRLVQMEIVVRDSNRFHSFHKGMCSCHDYW